MNTELSTATTFLLHFSSLLDQICFYQAFKAECIHYRIVVPLLSLQTCVHVSVCVSLPYFKRSVSGHVAGGIGGKLLLGLLTAEVEESLTIPSAEPHIIKKRSPQYTGPCYLRACSSLPGQSTPFSFRATGQK